MSIRVLGVFLAIAIMSILSLRGGWFKAICGLFILMAFMQHPDMPKSIGGIQGLNAWNLLMLNVTLGWFIYRQPDRHEHKIPPYIKNLLLAYALVVFVGFIRLWSDPKNLDDFSSAYIFSEYFINTFKWVIPGLLLYNGCRTRNQIVAVILIILAFYLLIALQVIKCMPLHNVTSGEDLNNAAARILQKRVGFHRVNVSMMLAGACWAFLSILPIAQKKSYKIITIFCAITVSLGQALTGGRTGYVTWGIVGLILFLIRWKKFLPLIPITIILVFTFIPSVKERMLFGIVHGKDNEKISSVDSYSMTSGRTLIWPYVIQKIIKSPIVGYGRLAMNRTGLSNFLMKELDESFPHPHNAYLELLLDNGLLGFILIIPFFIVVLFQSIKLLLVRDDNLCTAVGGFTTSLILSFLISGMGSQSFYPKEADMIMWAAIFLMLRVRSERLVAIREGRQVFDYSAQYSEVA
jgi:O-antigen ligase